VLPRIEPVPECDLDPTDRAVLERAVAENRIASDLYPRVVAHHPVAFASLIRGLQEERAYYGATLLGERMCELLRHRSAQLGGCEDCARARYVTTDVSEDDIECVIADRPEPFDERERRALRFMTLMHTDHHSIDDRAYAELAEVFTTAEVVELGQLCVRWVGLHRWLHTLDLLDTRPASTSGRVR
jgi:hypothetical protein